MPVSPELLPIVRAQLKEGEGVGWAMSAEPVAFELGERRKGIWDAVAILGGGYAAVGATVATFRSGQPLWMLLPLALVGLGVLTYFAVERIKARERKRVACTVYALTTRRALLIQTFPKLTVQALPIESITDVVLDNVREAFGDLTLTTSAASTGLVFRGVFEPEQARKDMQKVLRDPTGAEQQIAASERYMIAMRQFGQKRPLS
jgi:hypothetical protein